MGEPCDNISSNEEIIDLVASMMGYGYTGYKIREAVEKELDCEINEKIFIELVKSAQQRIIAKWDKSHSEYCGSILQGIHNDLSNPKTKLRERISLLKLLVSLGSLLDKEKPGSTEDDWAHSSPDQIVQAMDDLTSSK